MLEPGLIVAEVARRWQVCPLQVFTWRQEMRAGAATRLSFVLIVAQEPTPTSVAWIAPVPTSPAIELKLAGAMRRVERGTDGNTLTTVLQTIRASAA